MKKWFIAFAMFFFFALGGAPPDPPAGTTMLKGVPKARQSTPYSCGAAALQSVLGYYGNDDYNETELMQLLGTTPEGGTILENMAKFADEHGIETRIASNQTLAQLKAHLAKDQAIIVEAQAWQDDPSKPYPEEWDSGHYMVVIGLNHEHVYFMDPSIFGGYGYLPAKDFLARWHEVSAKGEKLYHTALYFEGEPAPLAGWQYVE